MRPVRVKNGVGCHAEFIGGRGLQLSQPDAVVCRLVGLRWENQAVELGARLVPGDRVMPGDVDAPCPTACRRIVTDAELVALPETGGDGEPVVTG